MTSTVDEAGIQDFSNSLSQLSAHPDADIIGMLTGFADDLKTSAPRVLSLLTNRILTVPDTHKVPLLYLLDSIVKSKARASYAQPFANVAANLFLQVFQSVGDKDRLRMRRVLKTWREMKLLPLVKSEPVWTHVQTWIMSNPERVAIAEGKRPPQQRRSASAPRSMPPQQLHQLQPQQPQQQQQRGVYPYQQQRQDPFRQFVHEQQIRMQLPPKSLEELQMIDPGLIHSFRNAFIPPTTTTTMAAAPIPTTAATAQYHHQPPHSHSHSLHINQPPLSVSMALPHSSTTTAATTAAAASSAPGGDGDGDGNDDAKALLDMLGGMDDDEEETTATTAAAAAATTATTKADADTTDVSSLFAILEGATGGGSSSITGPRTFPFCDANLAQAFQGNTAQLLAQLQVRDETSIGLLYRGKQDVKTGLRFSTEIKYENQISFNYHITQREKALDQADLMRRWYLPFAHWTVQPSPYHTLGNEFIQYTTEQQMRDAYMTTKEAKQMAQSGGVVAAASGSNSSNSSSSKQVGSLLLGLLKHSGGGGSGGGGGGEGKGKDTSSSGGCYIDANGVSSIPVDNLLPHETKKCIVCQEVFASEFDDSADRWVYKEVRRVPSGLIHCHCWTPEAEGFQLSKKRSLDDNDSALKEDDEMQPATKRIKT
jgi:hypothetical protein